MSKKCKSLFKPALKKQLKKQLLEELIFRERLLLVFSLPRMPISKTIFRSRREFFETNDVLMPKPALTGFQKAKLQMHLHFSAFLENKNKLSQVNAQSFNCFLREVYKSYSSINLNVRHDNSKINLRLEDFQSLEDFQKQKPKDFIIRFDEM